MHLTWWHDSLIKIRKWISHKRTYLCMNSILRHFMISEQKVVFNIWKENLWKKRQSLTVTTEHLIVGITSLIMISVILILLSNVSFSWQYAELIENRLKYEYFSYFYMLYLNMDVVFRTLSDWKVFLWWKGSSALLQKMLLNNLIYRFLKISRMLAT